MCRINNKIILGEAKFLTSDGGNQNAQFFSALNTIKSKFNPTKHEVKAIAILDGILYIPGNTKLYKTIQENIPVFSALLLRDYLYSL